MKQRRKRSQEEILAVLAELEAGAAPELLARNHGISPATLRRWRSLHGEEAVRELAELRQLRDENQRLRRIVARQVLELDAYREATDENW